jgi:hypothetical protein
VKRKRVKVMKVAGFSSRVHPQRHDEIGRKERMRGKVGDVEDDVEGKNVVTSEEAIKGLPSDTMTNREEKDRG